MQIYGELWKVKVAVFAIFKSLERKYLFKGSFT